MIYFYDNNLFLSYTNTTYKHELTEVTQMATVTVNMTVRLNKGSGPTLSEKCANYYICR